MVTGTIAPSRFCAFFAGMAFAFLLAAAWLDLAPSERQDPVQSRAPHPFPRAERNVAFVPKRAESAAPTLVLPRAAHRLLPLRDAPEIRRHPLPAIAIPATPAMTSLTFSLPAMPYREDENANGKPAPSVANPRAIDPANVHVVAAPDGYYAFAVRYPGEVKDSEPAFATRAQIELAERVNATVNARIAYRATRLWKVEAEGLAYGDCKSYALSKRHALRDSGVPDGASRLAVVNAGNYDQRHMIIEVQSVDGIYVLDSLPNDESYRFYRDADLPSQYAMIEFQAWGRPEHWLAPNNSQPSNTPIARNELHRSHGVPPLRMVAATRWLGFPSVLASLREDFSLQTWAATLRRIWFSL
jgi:predicted transglutaminase-like cysteine proteinase